MPPAQSSTQSSLPAVPSVAVPGFIALAGLLVCWLSGDVLVVRAGGSVVAVAAFVAVAQLGRYLRKTLPSMAAELRARNRDLARLRKAIDQMLDQVNTHREDATAAREQVEQVREEAAALLEVLEERTGPVSTDAPQVAEPPAPKFATASPPAAPAPQAYPVASAFPEPETFAMPQSFAEPYSDDGTGYLRSFSLDDDEPLTSVWPAADTSEDEVPHWGQQPGSDPSDADLTGGYPREDTRDRWW